MRSQIRDDKTLKRILHTEEMLKIGDTESIFQELIQHFCKAFLMPLLPDDTHWIKFDEGMLSSMFRKIRSKNFANLIQDSSRKREIPEMPATNRQPKIEKYWWETDEYLRQFSKYTPKSVRNYLV